MADEDVPDAVALELPDDLVAQQVLVERDAPFDILDADRGVSQCHRPTRRSGRAKTLRDERDHSDERVK
jgi:hypothetical protein